MSTLRLVAACSRIARRSASTFARDGQAAGRGDGALEFFRKRIGAIPKAPRTYRGPLGGINELPEPPQKVTAATAKLRLTYKGSEFTDERLQDFLAQLARLQVSGDRRAAQSLWDSINRYRLGISPLARMPRELPGEGSPNYKKIPESLYQKLLEMSSVLRMEDLTKAVWEDMARCGIELDVKMWHARLHGLCRLRDPVGLENTWAEMVATGLQPDVFCWVARVRGLISSRQWLHGIQALNEMGNAWEAAAKKHLGVAPDHSVPAAEYARLGDINGVPKPNAITLNAALQELRVMKRRSYYDGLVHWASRLGVQWDTQTYNILIKPFLARYEIHKAVTMLQQMEAAGLQPDSATYTMFLQAALTNPRAFGETEPFAAASKVLSSMKDAVVKPSVVTYGLLINHIIDLHSPRLVSAEELAERRVQAEAVLAHMREIGVGATSAVYVTMASSYLDTRSPDVPAFERLWAGITARNFQPDYIFYDRVMIAFAELGDVERALAFCQMAQSQGKPPGWRALAAVGRGLVREGKDEELLHFVQEVLREELSDSVNSVRVSTERELFFSFVRECIQAQILPKHVLDKQ